MKAKTKLPAYMNHGRWMARCPQCNNTLPLGDGNGVVCPMCYPGMTAKYSVALPSPPYPMGARRMVADHIVIEETRDMARANGHMYVGEFPRERAQIERILRMRPRANMNWLPGEDIAYLRRDNTKHKIPLPEEKCKLCGVADWDHDAKGAVVCVGCGAQRDDVASARKCPRCGGMTKPGLPNCASCGQPLKKVVINAI